MILKLKCTIKEFKNVDIFLMSQEFKEKPEYDKIELSVYNKDATISKYNYRVEKHFNNWFIVTD